MKPWNSSVWKDIPNVTVTSDHVDRAMCALVEESPPGESGGVALATVMIAATIIAYMEAFSNHKLSRWMLVSVVHAALGDDLTSWVIRTYGFVHPNDWKAKQAQLEREERRVASVAKAKATREANRAAEIEAAVSERLKAA